MAERDPDPKRRARDLVDQSQLRKRRAQRRIDQSLERIQRAEHRWIGISLGRVCEKCKTAQMTGEFDEDVPCVAS